MASHGAELGMPPPTPSAATKATASAVPSTSATRSLLRRLTSAAQHSDDDDEDDDGESKALVSFSGRPPAAEEGSSGASPRADVRVLPEDAAPPTHFCAAARAASPTRVLRVTPIAPPVSPELRRRRSAYVLQRTRARRLEEEGVAPRMVRDAASGMLLPRDQVVPVPSGGAASSSSAAGHDDPQALAGLPPAQGEGEGEGGFTVHYRRSVDVLNALKERRLLRAIDFGGL